jgi:hypothetical protein
MTKNEWDKAFGWMMDLFPAWKVTANTSLVWYEELGTLATLEQFKTAFRLAMNKNNSGFVPSVSQIRAELIQDENSELLAIDSWNTILWNREIEDPITDRVFKMLGSPSNLRFIQNEELKWIEKKFIKLWVLAYEEFNSKTEKEKFVQLESVDFKKLTNSIGTKLQVIK